MEGLVLSAIFIVLGFILIKWPPKNINYIYGYRMPSSMKNQDTWDEAQKLGGISLSIFGVVIGIFGLWSIIKPLDINNETALGVFLIVGVIVMIIIDEMKLRKIFNKDGSRKNKI